MSIDHSQIKPHSKLLRAVSSFTLAAVMFTSTAPAAVSTGVISEVISASADTVEEVSAPAQVKLLSEARYSGTTHPYKHQTDRLKIRWKEVSGADSYQLYIKGGKYKKYTKIADTSKLSYTVKGLQRIKTYKFKVRAVNDGVKGKFSKVQTLRTARIDFDKNGWKAMCRIVYHEVGCINDRMWDAPIVHVSDCVVNRFEAAKYLGDEMWEPYYSGYNTVQSMIYKSGDFMSSSGLTRDGATYAKCTATVKKGVYGALYSKVMLSGEKPSKKVFFWSNTTYKPKSKKIAYSYKIPWGYFNVWKKYWG